ncbi:FtsX-like permease family protein [uncultured Parolsenella sp.]|uniref:FtsX-like permease family protein n=1 Tax=uncultured Parolsenella sp. TaxID=2083008 RepID=UPI0027D987DA|nr:FtsX-like permease family protein [uncultured Parolsenella sp.]
MLCKLAFGNVRRAGRDYLVYLITLALGVTVFYAFNTISEQAATAGLDREMGDAIGDITSGLTVFLACVMGFLMVYANNFIMKRRKQQFGLYQVLGMGRGQVATIMTLETAIVSAGALAIGLACGIGLSQLMTFFTASLFRTQIANFHFFVSASAALFTVECLVAIFLVTLVFNLRVVAKAKVIDLMGARRSNEAVAARSPWVSAALFVVGCALVGVAYERLLRDGLPLMMNSQDEMTRFTVTTVTVIAGTILLFFGLSGFLLKVLQAARGLWWRGLNMFTLRQLAAKVNTVSMSMAVISMILFLALTSVTTGMSIANVMNEGVERGTPADYTTGVAYHSPSTLRQLQQSEQNAGLKAGTLTEGRVSTTRPVDVLDATSSHAKRTDGSVVDLAAIAGPSVQVDVFDSAPALGEQPLVSIAEFARAAGKTLPRDVNTGDDRDSAMGIMSESTYNRYLAFRDKGNVSLDGDQYLVTSDMGPSVVSIYNAALAAGHEVTLGGHTLRPARTTVDENASSFVNMAVGNNTGTLVVPDEVLAGLNLPVQYSYLLLDYPAGSDASAIDKKFGNAANYGTVTDTAGQDVGSFGMGSTRISIYESTDSVNGLISYLSIYIGFVLVVACGAILTIQQLSGVADAVPGWRLLAELGADGASLRRSLLAQQAVFFAFPLVVALAHSAVALRVIIDVVETLGALTIGGTVGLTCVIFVAAYGGYFLLTYAMGAGIVREAAHGRRPA